MQLRGEGELQSSPSESLTVHSTRLAAAGMLPSHVYLIVDHAGSLTLVLLEGALLLCGTQSNQQTALSRREGLGNCL